MAGGEVITAAGAATLGGAVVMASDGGSEAGEATGDGTTLTSSGAGAAPVGGAAAACQRPACHEVNTSVTLNAPSASAPKSICLFNQRPRWKTLNDSGLS